jgi:hypothetical protein
MPELPVKETRLSELHLPEISRKDIMRSLSEMRMPDVDLPDAVTKRDWMPDVDLGKAVAGAAAAAHIGRRSPRRWPFAVAGLIVAGVATAAVLSNETIRTRISNGFDALRERFYAMRSSGYDELEIDRDEVVAFDSAETAPITDPTPYTDDAVLDTTAEYPSGLGSNGHEDGIPAFEESTSRS